jgi:hypothetical protein
MGVRDRAGVFAALVRAPGDPDGSGRVLLPHNSYTVTDKNLQAELEGACLIVSEPESGGISRHNAGETCLMPDYRVQPRIAVIAMTVSLRADSGDSRHAV